MASQCQSTWRYSMHVRICSGLISAMRCCPPTAENTALGFRLHNRFSLIIYIFHAIQVCNDLFPFIPHSLIPDCFPITTSKWETQPRRKSALSNQNSWVVLRSLNPHQHLRQSLQLPPSRTLRSPIRIQCGLARHPKSAKVRQSQYFSSVALANSNQMAYHISLMRTAVLLTATPLEYTIVPRSRPPLML